MNDYWTESLHIAFEEADLPLPTPEQTKIMVESLENSREHENLGAPDYGPPPGVDPQEVENLKYEIKQLQKQIDTYRSSVAQRRGVAVENVYTRDGEVFYG